MRKLAVPVLALSFLAVFAAGCVILRLEPSTLDRAAAKVGLATPYTRGFLDSAGLTAADADRIKSLRNAGFPDATQAFVSRGGSLTMGRRDVELLRQDRRRAQAAYPDVPAEELLLGSWFWFYPEARVPASWGGSNSSSVGVGDEAFLDGPSFLPLVAAPFTERASPSDTAAFFLAKAKARQATLASRRHVAWSSNGGDGSSERVRCSLLRGCVVRVTGPTSVRESVWRFRFDQRDWLASDGYPSLAQVKATPSFSGARERPGPVKQPTFGAALVGCGNAIPANMGDLHTYVIDAHIPPDRVAVTLPRTPKNCTSTGQDLVPYRPGMTLGPGQSTSITVPVLR